MDREMPVCSWGSQYPFISDPEQLRDSGNMVERAYISLSIHDLLLAGF